MLSGLSSEDSLSCSSFLSIESSSLGNLAWHQLCHCFGARKSSLGVFFWVFGQHQRLGVFTPTMLSISLCVLITAFYACLKFLQDFLVVGSDS